jgi:hypothetical protein
MTALMRTVSTTASRRALSSPELSALDTPLDLRAVYLRNA